MRDRNGVLCNKTACELMIRIAITYFAVFVTTALPLSAAETVRSNIVIVLADDFGWGHLACNGGTLEATPQLDRMAREGVRFTQFYVASPICSLSRCGITTGQFSALENHKLPPEPCRKQILRDGRLPRPRRALASTTTQASGLNDSRAELNKIEAERKRPPTSLRPIRKSLGASPGWLSDGGNHYHSCCITNTGIN